MTGAVMFSHNPQAIATRVRKTEKKTLPLKHDLLFMKVMFFYHCDHKVCKSAVNLEPTFEKRMKETFGK